MFLTYIICTVATIIVVRLVKRFLAYWTFFNNLPGEKDFRLLTGNMHLLPGNNDEGLSYDIENATKYKYYHRVWAGPFIPVLVVYHPDVMKQILKSQAPKPRSKLSATVYDMGVRWLGEGLIIANGNKWARSRRLLTPAFHFEVLRSYLDTYNKCTHILSEKLLSLSKSGKSCEIYAAINMCTLDVILRCAFSYSSDCQTQESQSTYINAIHELQSLWSKRALDPFMFNEFIYGLSAEGKTFCKLCDVAHKVSDEVITKRKEELEKNSITATKKRDFLDILLSARDEDGNGLTSLELRNEVDTFMFAGHDTTASAISWSLYALAGHPEYQERVYEEVMEVMGDRQNVEWSDLAKLEYTTMCIKEAIRLHGPVPLIERITSEEMTFNNTVFPAGTRVALHIYILHHNPHVWEDPNKFLPERFHQDKQALMNPFQYIPFSAGSRNCIGQNFAMNEMKSMIAKLIRRFKLSIDETHTVRHAPLVTMKPESGMYLHFSPRS